MDQARDPEPPSTEIPDGMRTHRVRPLGRPPSSDTDLRHLTLLGWFFGAISIAIVLGGAVSFYLWRPLGRYYGIHVYGDIPALIVGIPLAGVAVGFFMAARFACEAVGMPFVRRNAAGCAADTTVAVPGNFPCTTATFELRLGRLNRLERILRVAAYVWGFPALVAGIVIYDKSLGPRTNGFTDLLYFVVGGLLSLGPAAYLKMVLENPKTFTRYGLACPDCRTPLIGANAQQVCHARCCPVCGLDLISDRVPAE